MADADGDLLSELLAPMRLHGVFHSRWSMRAPWGIAGDREDCALLHYVHQGTCVVEMPTDPTPIRLGTGDVALFPRGTAHRLGDQPNQPTIPLASLLPTRELGTRRTVDLDGPGPVTTMLCGGLHYHRPATTPLYQALPDVIVVDAVSVRAQPLLDDALQRLATGWERDEPGDRLIALRAFELVFLLALRTAVISGAGHAPILHALRHPGVSAALLAIHTRFTDAWTVESLAAEGGLSRSAFAATFTSLVGQSPMAHLKSRRMQEAAHLLGDTELAHARIAERVGYRSTVGFHLAFRSTYGQTPGEYRRLATSRAA